MSEAKSDIQKKKKEKKKANQKLFWVWWNYDEKYSSFLGVERKFVDFKQANILILLSILKYTWKILDYLEVWRCRVLPTPFLSDTDTSTQIMNEHRQTSKFS